MTVSTSSLPASAIQALIAAAARPEDIVGTLVEGSAALLTLRPHAEGGEAEIEQSFIDRLQPAMTDLCERRIGGRLTLWLRAVHRPATDIAYAAELISSLFDAQALPFTVNAESDADTIALSNRVILFRSMQAIFDPFIEPATRMPASLRILDPLPEMPRFDS